MKRKSENAFLYGPQLSHAEHFPAVIGSHNV